MFKSRIERMNGALTIFVQSAALESMMKSLSGDTTSNVAWTDGTIEGADVKGEFSNFQRWNVKVSHLQATLGSLKTCTTGDLFAENGAVVNLIPLMLKGLGKGITIKPSRPYPAGQLKAYGKHLEEVAAALLTAMQPVIVTIEVTPKEAQPLTPLARAAVRAAREAADLDDEE